ncbi:MAG: hypothetical protein IJC26_04290, partial [Clostridia bacterium]|nr:hypothetical protein [Clostridia bacterium]
APIAPQTEPHLDNMKLYLKNDRQKPQVPCDCYLLDTGILSATFVLPKSGVGGKESAKKI